MSTIDKSLAQSYNSSNTYDVGDVVLYNNKMYECAVANSGGKFNDKNWQRTYLMKKSNIREPQLQSKQVTTNTIDQVITPDEGYDGLSKVTVPAITLQEKISTLDTSLTNITFEPDEKYDGLSKVSVSIDTQEKEVVLGSTNQTITPDSGRVLSKVTVPAVQLQEKASILDISNINVVLEPDDGFDGLSKATVSITLQEKTATLGTTSQEVIPDSGRVLSKVTIPAINLQSKSSTLNTSSTTVTLIPDEDYNGLSKATVSITPQEKSVTLGTSAQTITPDSGKVLSKVSVPAVPGNAGTSHVLATKTFSSTSAGVNKTGTMKNNGAVAGTISTSGGTYTIPEGYHNGSGKVTGPTLSNLIGTNATLSDATKLLTGNTAYGKNGTKYTGNMTNNAGKTVATSAVTTDATKTYLTIPTNAYYDSTSKISVSNADIVSASLLYSDYYQQGVGTTNTRKYSGTAPKTGKLCISMVASSNVSGVSSRVFQNIVVNGVLQKASVARSDGYNYNATCICDVVSGQSISCVITHTGVDSNTSAVIVAGLTIFIV